MLILIDKEMGSFIKSRRDNTLKNKGKKSFSSEGASHKSAYPIKIATLFQS